MEISINISMEAITYNITPTADGTKVSIAGVLKSINAIDLKSELHKFISKRERLIVDITQISDIDLTGLNALMFTKIKCSLKYSDMTLIADDKHPIMKLLRLTKSEGQFNMQKPVLA